MENWNGAILSLLALACVIPAVPVAAEGGAGEVTIRRDQHGVPHVFAEDRRALFYGFGYALAEDRLFQAEMTRRTATGTVAEVLGAEYLAKDKATRGNYDPVSIRQQYASLGQQDRDIFEGYAAGYNARVREVLASNRALLPQEFEHYGFMPEEIEVDDLLAIFVHDFMIRFSGYNGELDNLRLLSALGEQHSEDDAIAIFRQLRWELDTRSRTTIEPGEGSAGRPPTFEVEERLRAVLRAKQRPQLTPASDLKPISSTAFSEIRKGRALAFGAANADDAPHASLGWASGKRMTQGAIGTYVDGAQMGFTSPSPVWGVGLHGAGFSLEGYTLVGVPLVLFGTNGKIAWGGSAGMGDVVDMYQEVLNPGNSREYLFKGEYVPFGVRSETINVKDADPVTIEVFSTGHGLVKAFDEKNGTAYAEKRAWQGRELESLLGWLGATQQTNFKDFREQTSRWGISANWLYGDNKGDVSYIYTARYPDRPDNQDFRLPAIGTGEMEWKGFKPFSDNPTVSEPARNWLATWNNRSITGYHSSDSIYWAQVERTNALHSELDSRTGVTPRDMWDISKAVAFVDASAGVIKPMLVSALQDVQAGTDEAKARDLLAAWEGRHSDEDGNGYYDAPGQTIYTEWLKTAQRHLFARDTPPEFWDSLGLTKVISDYPTTGTKALANALQGAEAGVPQKFDFLRGESREHFIQRTLSETLARLKSSMGTDIATWNTPVVPHKFAVTNFSGVPISTPERAVQLPAYMNRATFKFWVTFEDDGATTMCDALAPGQSAFQQAGHQPEAAVTDQLATYGNFECNQRPITLHEIKAQQKSERTLRVER